MLGLGSCEAVEELTRDGDAPSAEVAEVEIENLGLDNVDLAFQVEVFNPTAAAVAVNGTESKLSTGGVVFAESVEVRKFVIPADGKLMVPVTTRISFSNLQTKVAGLSPGSEVPYVAEILLRGVPGEDTDGLRVSNSGSVPIPVSPRVKLIDITWQSLSLLKAQGLLGVQVSNPNSFPMDMDSLSYSLKLGGRKILTTAVEQYANLPDDDVTRIEIPVTFMPSSVGDGTLEMLQSSGAPHVLAGQLSLMTPYGLMSLPFHEQGQTTFLR